MFIILIAYPIFTLDYSIYYYTMINEYSVLAYKLDVNKYK
jgi:hypothetical protein